MAESSDPMSLVPTLRVRVAGDTVSMELTVANGGPAPEVLTFGTSQRYDFAVVDEAGTEVWRWSRDRLFAQAVSEEAVPAGGGLSYGETWLGGAPGRYRLVASLTSMDHPVELQAEFEVPAE